jgi:beta-phosphoglucomutase
LSAAAYQAVFFDFDGVIARTMEDNHRAWMAAFAPHGVEIDRDEYFLIEGTSVRGVAAFFGNRAGLAAAVIEEIARAKEAHYAAHHTFAFYPGIPELIDAASARAPLGVVSGGNADRLAATAGRDFLAKFQVLITGDMVQRPKPDPEPYLRAAGALAVSPARCLVVENAPMGIASAKAAGMTCIAICSTLPAAQLADADFVAQDHTGLRRLLEV